MVVRRNPLAILAARRKTRKSKRKPRSDVGVKRGKQKAGRRKSNSGTLGNTGGGSTRG